MIFKSPYLLLLIPLIIILAMLLTRGKKPSAITIPSDELLVKNEVSWKLRLWWMPLFLRMLVIILFVIALAGPRAVLEEFVYETEGIDIVLAIDCSGSMAAEDFTIKGQRVNRLKIVKDVVNDFIESRKSDQIGLVAFAGLAYAVSPLTTDYSWLKTNLNRIELGLIEDGTAIGSAIASSVSRLRKSSGESKVMVLLTDGVNNSGEITPVEAARLAEQFGVKIYTIGAGTKGYVPYPAVDIFGRKTYRKVIIDLDEKSLRQIADITGGRYFRATDERSLREIYAEIDQLEKTEIEEIGYKEYKELFYIPLWLGLSIFFLEILLKNTVYLRLP